jgi:hypothetical protein
MIVDDFDVVGIAVPPGEADTPLIVYSDTVPAATVPFESLKSVSRRNQQIKELNSGVQYVQFSQSGALKICAEPLHAAALKQRLSMAVGKARKHVSNDSACR